MENQNLALSEQWTQQTEDYRHTEASRAENDVKNSLIGCFAVLERFGKTEDDLAVIIPTFIAALNGYKPKDVNEAFSTYIKTASKFPTPSDILKIIEGKKGGSSLADTENHNYPWAKRSYRINCMVHEADAEFRVTNKMDLVRSEGWDAWLMELVRNIAYVQAQVITLPMLTMPVGIGIPPLPMFPFSQSVSSFWEDIKSEAMNLHKPRVVFNDRQKIELRDYFRYVVKKGGL